MCIRDRVSGASASGSPPAPDRTNTMLRRTSPRLTPNRAATSASGASNSRIRPIVSARASCATSRACASSNRSGSIRRSTDANARSSISPASRYATARSFSSFCLTSNAWAFKAADCRAVSSALNGRTFFSP